MKSSVLTIAIVGLYTAAPIGMRAQMTDESSVPKVLMVTQEQVKEGREGAHARSETAWPRIFQKGNVRTHYIGMASESGPSEAWFLEPYESFGAMEKERAAILHSAMAPELETANVTDGELRTGSRTLLTVFRGDLSFHAAEAMQSLPKCRYMGVTVLNINYGREADLVQLAHLLIDGDEKSGSDQPALTYQVISGAPAVMYLLFAPMDSLARMDAAPARSTATRQAMGERNRQHFDALAAEVVHSSENLLFSFDPRMSYVSKEFAAADPAFWTPAEPAKPAAKAKPARKP